MPEIGSPRHHQWLDSPCLFHLIHAFWASSAAVGDRRRAVVVAAAVLALVEAHVVAAAVVEVAIAEAAALDQDSAAMDLTVQSIADSN